MLRLKLCSILVFVALIISVSAAKERVSDQSLDELTSKLWHEIEKRLQDDEGMLSEGDRNVLSQFGDESNDDGCHYDSLNGTIVRTHDSQARGAQFLNSIDSDTDPELDLESCLQACCDEDQCNLAVFKNKKPDHSCYLFDCGSPSVCLFTSHPGFSAHSLPTRRNGNKEQEKHADELENLAVATTTISTTKQPTTKATTTTTTTTTEAPTLPPKKTPVGLFGECKEHQDCAVGNSECLAGYCLCQEGFHAQDAMCNPKQDSSDITKLLEDNGQSSDAFTPSMPSPSAQVHKIIPQAPHSTPVVQETNKNEEESENPAEETLQKIDDGGIAAPNTLEENDPSNKVEILTDKPTVIEEKIESDQNDDVAVEPVKETQVENNSVVSAISSQGAVIALALGLALTAILLVFVGCRLRNMKHRLRKGRPLNSNEADYLINGMYL